MTVNTTEQQATDRVQWMDLIRWKKEMLNVGQAISTTRRTPLQVQVSNLLSKKYISPSSSTSKTKYDNLEKLDCRLLHSGTTVAHIFNVF